MLAVLCLCASAAAFTPVAISAQLAQHGGDTVDCVLDGHTRLCLRRSFSKRDVPTGRRVPVLSLTNIAVDSPFRRQGHARRAMRALSKYAATNRCALVVENVVSDHMHGLIEELDGQPLWGSRRGAKGCNYWLPPSASTSWQDLAV